MKKPEAVRSRVPGRLDRADPPASRTGAGSPYQAGRDASFGVQPAAAAGATGATEAPSPPVAGTSADDVPAAGAVQASVGAGCHSGVSCGVSPVGRVSKFGSMLIPRSGCCPLARTTMDPTAEGTLKGAVTLG